MCVYCEEAKPKKYEFKAEGGISTIGQTMTEWLGIFKEDSYDDSDAIQINGGNLYWDSSTHEYSTLGCKINYCPFCGMRLRYDTSYKGSSREMDHEDMGG